MSESWLITAAIVAILLFVGWLLWLTRNDDEEPP
jgi:hypothetical protein